MAAGNKSSTLKEFFRGSLLLLNSQVAQSIARVAHNLKGAKLRPYKGPNGKGVTLVRHGYGFKGGRRPHIYFLSHVGPEGIDAEKERALRLTSL